MSWWSCFGISFSLVYTYYSRPIWDCVEIWAVPHILFESHMIVSLSLILSKTGLRLRCQQIATHCNSLMLRPCCEWVWTAARTWPVLPWVYNALRPCCLETHAFRATQRDSGAILYQMGHGGILTLVRRIYDFSNLCYFLSSKDSRYCFLSCNCCSL